jgi:spore coat protein U-like protein
MTIVSLLAIFVHATTFVSVTVIVAAKVFVSSARFSSMNFSQLGDVSSFVGSPAKVTAYCRVLQQAPTV